MIEKIETCDLCSGETENYSITLARGWFSQYGVETTVHTVMCRRCKYIFQLERFNTQTLAWLYEQDNGYDPAVEIKHTQAFVRNKYRRQQALTAALEVAGLFSTQGRLKVLDVGGGVGEVTEHLTGRCDVYLAEMNSSEPLNSSIIKIHAPFEQLVTTQSFDVIVMCHVLEHVFSPVEFLRKAHSILSDRGIVYIEVPFELYTPMVFKRIGDWRHIAYFSTAVLRRFLVKAGLAPKSVQLCTGYYHDRQLAVIRAVARRGTVSETGSDLFVSYWDLLRDGLNPNALRHYFMSQLAKLKR